MHLCDARISKLAFVLSQDLNTPLSVLALVFEQKLPSNATTIPIGPGRHQLTSVPGLRSRATLGGSLPQVPVVTRVSINLSSRSLFRSLQQCCYGTAEGLLQLGGGG